MREKSAEAPKLFEAMSRLTVDPQAAPHYRELGNILRQYMGGIKNPTLAALPKEVAEIVKKALSSLFRS